MVPPACVSVELDRSADLVTPTFCCGGECGVSGVGTHWPTVSGTRSFDTTTVRSGARSLRVNPTVGAGEWSTVAGVFTGGVAVYRYYVNFTTLPSASTELSVGNNTTGGAYFKSSDSKIYASFNITTGFGATGVTVTTGVWYCIDVKVISTANPHLIDVSVDGVACGQSSHAVAASTTNEALSLRVGIFGNVTTDVFYDDVVTSATTGDYPIGEGYVNHFIPTSDGTHSGLTAGDYQRTLTGTDILLATTTAYQLIDDVPLESGASVDWINMVAPAAAADYVECVYGPASGISTPTVAPRAVDVICGYHQAGTGTGNMELRLNDNGTTSIVYTATTVAGVTSVAYVRKHYATGPAGAWTVTAGAGNFNNIRIRFGCPAAVDANPDQYFDCTMIEAEFAPAAGGRTTKNTRAWPLGTEIGMNWRSGGV